MVVVNTLTPCFLLTAAVTFAEEVNNTQNNKVAQSNPELVLLREINLVRGQYGRKITL